MDGEVGVIEGRVIETTEFQPWIAASEDMVDEGGAPPSVLCWPPSLENPNQKGRFGFPGRTLRQRSGCRIPGHRSSQ